MRQILIMHINVSSNWSVQLYESMAIGMSERSRLFSLLYQVKLLACVNIVMLICQRRKHFFHVHLNVFLMGAEVGGLEK